MASPEPRIFLSILGTPRLRQSGRDVGLALKHGYALLTYLAFVGGAVPRRVLADLLWPGADEETGRSRLRRLVYNLQKLAPGSIVGEGGSLSANPGLVEVDALEFARQARHVIAGGTPQPGKSLLDRYPGAFRPMLHGVDIGSPEFDDWIRLQAVEHEHLLARLLRIEIEVKTGTGDFAEALRLIEQLIALDRYCEPSYVSLMNIRARMGDAAGVEAAFMRCASELRSEFGSKPGSITEQSYLALLKPLRQGGASGLAAQPLAIKFAHAESGAVAYATIGKGPETIVIIPGFISHIEIGWEQPSIRSILERLAQTHRVLVFDCRGVGLSERIGTKFNADSAVSDVLTILDHAGIDKAWLFGSSEGGPVAIRLAARYGNRVRGVALFGAMAKGSAGADYPWALDPAAFDTWMEKMLASWGGPSDLDIFAPSERSNPQMLAWWARMLRHATTPASMQNTLAALREVDVRAELDQIGSPTLILHRAGDRAVRFDAGKFLARNIRGAAFVALEGNDHWWWCGDVEAVLTPLLAFIQGQDKP